MSRRLRVVDHTLQVGELSDGARGVVRIVDPYHSRAVRHVGGNRLKVGKPAVRLGQRHPVALASREPGPDRVDRISGVRHQGHVPRVYEAERGVAYTLLGAYQGQDLLVGVEPYVEPAPVPVGNGPPELREAVRLRVTVVGRVKGGLPQRVDDRCWGRKVGVADAEADDLSALSLLLRDLPADLYEQVRRHPVQAACESHLSSNKS